MGEAQGDPCIMNLWVHDGSKDITVNRMKYRALLKDSLDQIFATEYKNMKDCIESKVFGIGLESYTVGSNDFYLVGAFLVCFVVCFVGVRYRTLLLATQEYAG